MAGGEGGSSHFRKHLSSSGARGAAAPSAGTGSAPNADAARVQCSATHGRTAQGVRNRIRRRRINASYAPSESARTCHSTTLELRSTSPARFVRAGDPARPAGPLAGSVCTGTDPADGA